MNLLKKLNLLICCGINRDDFNKYKHLDKDGNHSASESQNEDEFYIDLLKNHINENYNEKKTFYNVVDIPQHNHKIPLLKIESCVSQLYDSEIEIYRNSQEKIDYIKQRFKKLEQDIK